MEGFHVMCTGCLKRGPTANNARAALAAAISRGWREGWHRGLPFYACGEGCAERAAELLEHLAERAELVNAFRDDDTDPPPATDRNPHNSY